MALGGPGPRDWSPPASFADAPSGPPPRRPRTAWPVAEPPRATRPWAWATLAMLLGLGSLVMALAEPQRSGVQAGFVASTIGITAIVIGVRLVKDRHRFGSVARAFGRGAVILGSVGTALMAYAVLAFGLSTVGIHWPPLSLPSVHEGRILDDSVPAAVGTAAPSRPSEAPAPSAPEPSTAAAGAGAGAAAAPADAAVAPLSTRAEPTSFEAERSAVTMSAGTLAFVLEQRFGSGPYPSTLASESDAPARITLLDGTGLAPLPTGARVLYSTSPDRTAWSVTIIGARFGATASYSSAVGTVQSG